MGSYQYMWELVKINDNKLLRLSFRVTSPGKKGDDPTSDDAVDVSPVGGVPIRVLCGYPYTWGRNGICYYVHQPSKRTCNR